MKFRKIAVCALSLLVLTGCGASGDDDGSDVPETTQSTKQEAPKAPDIKTGESGKISANPQAVEKLDKLGGDGQDAWFISTVRDSGVSKKQMRDSSLLAARDKVCKAVTRGYTVNNIVSSVLSTYELTDKQNGVIIGASLTSGCPTKTVNVDAGLIQKKTNN